MTETREPGDQQDQAAQSPRVAPEAEPTRTVFEDMPDDFGTGAIDEASQLADRIEADHTGNIHALGDELLRKGKDLAGEDASPRETALLLLADGLICQLWLGTPEVVARWNGNALVPYMEFAEHGVFPPPVEAFPDSLRRYVELRAARARSNDTKARYNDFLWLRWRSFDSARTVHAAYLAAGTGSNLSDASSSMTALDYLRRAARMSIAFKYNRDDARRVIYDEVERSVPGQSLGFTCLLIETAAPLLAAEPERARRLIGSLEAQATAADEADGHRARSLFEAAGDVAGALGNATEKNDYLRRVAQSWEREAERRKDEGGLIVLSLLVDSLKIHTKLNDSADIQRLKDPIARAAQTSGDETKEISSTVKVNREELNAPIDAFAKSIDNGTATLLDLGRSVGLWRSWDAWKQDFDKARAEHPIQWLVTRFTISPNGEVNLPSDDDAERDEQNLLDFYTQQIQFRGAFADVAIERLRETGHWDAVKVIAAFEAIEPSWSRAMASGIEAYEAEDYWTACHVLVPQLERIMRDIAVTVSANVRSLASGGSLQFVTLGPMLADPIVNSVLGSAFCQSFAAAFCNPRGLNIRNRTAHGLLAPEEDQAIPASLTLMTALTLALIAQRILRAAAAQPEQPADP